jgi:hypothetical protein
MATDMVELFKIFYFSIMDFLNKTLIPQARKFFPVAQPKDPPDFFVFSVVGAVNRLMLKVMTHYRTFVAPMLEGEDITNFRGMWENDMKKSQQALENKLLDSLNKMLDSSKGYFSKCLSSMKHNCYKPAPSGEIPAPIISPAVAQVSQFCKSQYEAALVNLEGGNLDMYLTVLGNMLNSTVRLYLRGGKVDGAKIEGKIVNFLGFQTLAIDVRELKACVGTFHLNQVAELFEQLLALIQLIMPPDGDVDTVRAMITSQRKLVGVDPLEIYSFIILRSDFEKHRARYLQDIPILDVVHKQMQERKEN